MTAEKEPSAEAASQATAKETARTKKKLLSLFWSVGTGIGSRVVSLASTLLVTRFVDPASYGEVSVAYIVTLIAHLTGGLAITTYVATRPKATKKELFHAGVIFHGAGLVMLTLVYLLRGPLGAAFGGKNIEPYILGYIVFTLFERLTAIPEATLVRDERFRTAGIINSTCEVLYSVLVIVLAMRGMGGHAIVYAGVVRAGVRAALMLKVTSVREWTTPHKWDGAVARDILRFGVPMMTAQMSSLVARRGDNLAFSSLFGLARMGAYNLAYNLADMPAITIGERIGDVLVPSFAKLPPKDRPAELQRSITLIAFAVFPLAAGLSGVARPLTLIFNEQWLALDVGWMLAVLAFLSTTRPIEWAARVYLQVASQTRTIMLIEWVKVAGIMAAIFGLGVLGKTRSERLGAIGACAAVVLTFAVSTLGYLYVVARREKVSFFGFVGAMRKPGLCAGVMWAGLLLIDRYAIAPGVAAWRPGATGVGFIDRRILPQWDTVAGLLFGVTVGVALYGGMCLLVARKEIKQLIQILRSRKKRDPGAEAKAAEPGAEGAADAKASSADAAE
jgi:lipopolysaccharide exporter